METSKLMFALLRSIFQEKKMSEEVKREITSEVLFEIYKLSQKHDLAHLIAQALNYNELVFSDQAASKFIEKRGLAVFRVEQIEYELSEVRAVFEEEKIDYLPLKGAIIRKYYPQAWFRTCCDIDILVKKESLEKAALVLTERLGYVNKGKAYHDISMFSPSGVHLELHFNILESEENIDKLLAKVWDYAQKEKDGYAYTMSKEFLVFHVIAHASYHFLHGGCGIRSILDLYMLNKNMPYDKDKLANILQECGLTKYYEGLMALSAAWFEDVPLDEKYLDIEAYILNGGIYGTLQNRVAVEHIRKGGKWKYIWRRIFMSYEGLTQLYPSLIGKKWLIPFYQIRRWGRMIFGGRLRRSVRELNISSTLVEEERKKAREMMQTLGLL